MAYPFLPVNPCCTDIVINDPCGCSSVVTNSGCNNNNPCSTILTASSTIVYDGPALSCIIAEPCDTLNVILQKIDSIICNLLTQINTLNIQVSNITTQVLNLNSEVIIISNSLDQCCNVTTTTTSSTSTSTTTSTTTVAPAICENFSLTNTGVDPVAIIITNCTTQVESAIVLLPGDTDICVITDSPLVVPGTVIVVPNGPCFAPTTTTTSSSTSTTTSTSSTSSTTTTTTTAIPCECLTITNTDKLDHSFSYIDCNNDPINSISILAGEILSVCGCCAIANNELVTISIGANCSDGLCPTPTTTTTTTGFPCDCLTFENTDAYVHNIGYNNCNNDIVTGINIDPFEIISVCGSNGFATDPLVTITVGGVCVEGVCSEPTTTTTTTICAITIGTQLWGCANLDVTEYANGDPIPEVTDQATWAALTTGAWCYYNNDPLNGAIYGKLYNWYAVNDPRGLVPSGYHIPTNTDWINLINYLGGELVAGGPLKETGTVHWTSPNAGATNSSGFTGLPGGLRYNDGTFQSINDISYWWTSTLIDPSSSYIYGLDYSNAATSAISGTGGVFQDGYSVRLLKD